MLCPVSNNMCVFLILFVAPPNPDAELSSRRASLQEFLGQESASPSPTDHQELPYSRQLTHSGKGVAVPRLLFFGPVRAPRSARVLSMLLFQRALFLSHHLPPLAPAGSASPDTVMAASFETCGNGVDGRRRLRGRVGQYGLALGAGYPCLLVERRGRGPDRCAAARRAMGGPPTPTLESWRAARALQMERFSRMRRLHVWRREAASVVR